MERFVVLLMLTLSVAGIVAGKGALDPGQEVAVQNVFREMLKIQPPPPLSSQDQKKQPFTPPKHMLDLYRKYVSGGGPRKMTGNTVRSIVPSKGFASRGVSSLELLLFNVTCVSPSEEVHLAQLHLHRRRLARHQHWPSSRRVLAPPYRVRLYQLGGRGGRTTQLASVPVPHATRGGWHALDITPVLRELLLSNIQGPQLLGVKFEAPKGRQVSPTHFLKEPDSDKSGNSPAFLVVFSEDSPDNGIGEDGSETHVRLVPPHTHAIVEMIQTAQNDLQFPDESLFQQPLSETPNKTDEDFYLESSDTSQNNEIDSTHRHKHKMKQFEDEERNDLDADLTFFEGNSRKPSPRRHRNHSGSLVSNKIEDIDGEVPNRRVARSAVPSRSHRNKSRRMTTNKVDDIGFEVSGRVVRSVHDGDRTTSQRTLHNRSGNLVSSEVKDSNMDVSKRRVARSVGTSSQRKHRMTSVKMDDSNLEESSRRQARSVLDNELPEVEPQVPKTSPETLLASRQSPRHKQKQGTIPLPPGSASGSGKRARGARKRRGRGKKKRQRHRPDDHKDNQWLPEANSTTNSSAIPVDGPLCQRKRLVVDFADIGWDDFIVAPETFEAHYCAGACPFPLNKALKPTNHATIQSLVHIIGHQPDVPAPCCVPDQLSPVSMLYLDSAQNVVLKTYPAMAVDSCACR